MTPPINTVAFTVGFVYGVISTILFISFAGAILMSGNQNDEPEESEEKKPPEPKQ